MDTIDYKCPHCGKKLAEITGSTIGISTNLQCLVCGNYFTVYHVEEEQ